MAIFRKDDFDYWAVELAWVGPYDFDKIDDPPREYHPKPYDNYEDACKLNVLLKESSTGTFWLKLLPVVGGDHCKWPDEAAALLSYARFLPISKDRVQSELLDIARVLNFQGPADNFYPYTHVLFDVKHNSNRNGPRFTTTTYWYWQQPNVSVFNPPYVTSYSWDDPPKSKNPLSLKK